MHSEQLVKMANEIAAFFQAEAGADAVAREVASHLGRFWEPRMRRAIITHLAAGGEGLTASAREAIRLLETDTATRRG